MCHMNSKPTVFGAKKVMQSNNALMFDLLVIPFREGASSHKFWGEQVELIYMEGQSITPFWKKSLFFFSSVPPSNSLVSFSDPRRAFWADTAPFSGPRLASCVASGTTEIQGHRQVCRARRGGPRTPSTTTDANLDCAFVENALFTPILDWDKTTEYDSVSDQTCYTGSRKRALH